MAESAVQREIAALRVAFDVVGLGKSYPGVTALNNVTLSGFQGEVLAICGANGAGKSTLARLLAGQEIPTSGRIDVAGYKSSITGPAAAEAAGILLMHQEPLVIDSFTVEENVWLKQLSSSDGVKPWNVIKGNKAEATRAALDAVGLVNLDPHTPTDSLGPGPRQMLALSRTQVNHHRVLLLDETTASTTEEHFRDVLELVNHERADGVCVVFVSHRMPEVFAMADRIAVLRNGELIDIVRTSETTPDEIMTLMIGEAVGLLEPIDTIPAAHQSFILEVEGLSSGSATDVNLTVAAGEVLGVYGLVGSGRSSVARSISGHQPRSTGRVKLKGVEVTPNSPGDALSLGIAYLTEDRRKEGFVPAFTNAENLTLSTLRQSARWGVMNRKAERARALQLIEEYQVKGGADTFTRNLSGGNQQKVAIAKWLAAAPVLMILDEPTKGIDVGARQNIYEIIRAHASSGNGVLVVTSEAEEALKLCTRVLIMRDGRVVNEFFPGSATTDDLIRASLGGDAS